MENNNWSATWYNKIYCSNCGGIFELTTTRECSVCGKQYVLDRHEAFAGAIPWTSHVLLKLMQEEWKRPFNTDLSQDIYFKTSQRVIIVLLFWTQFETLIEQLLSTGMRTLPQGVSKLLLNKYHQITSRLQTLYPLLFQSTLSKDLVALGYIELNKLLEEVRIKRNDFLHGKPEAIDEDLVQRTVQQIPNLQEAWIKIYNLRCTEVN